jgi:hypothetical protein
MSEKLLWKNLKSNITDSFFTRIESSSSNGVPDVHGVMYGHSFWIELKSDDVSYPALNKWQVVWINKYIKKGGVVFILKETLEERCLKLYRPVSVFTDPRSLKPRAVFSFPYDWGALELALQRELGIKMSYM